MAQNGIGSASESDVTSRDTDEQVLDFDDDTLNVKIVYHQKALNVAKIKNKI